MADGMFPDVVANMDKLRSTTSMFMEQLTYGRGSVDENSLFSPEDILRIMSPIVNSMSCLPGYEMTSESKEVQDLRAEVQELKTSVQSEMKAMREDLAAILAAVKANSKPAV